MTKKKHYVNNKDFHAAIVEYQKLCTNRRAKQLPLPTIPDYIGVCIDMICRKLSLRGNFIRYTFLEEMIEDGIMYCVAAVDKFNTKYKNPHAYFTSIAWHAFVRRIDQEMTENYTKHKNLEDLFVLSDEFYIELGSSKIAMGTASRSSADSDGLQRHYDVIKKFEEKVARKKEKTRQAGLQKKKVNRSR